MNTEIVNIIAGNQLLPWKKNSCNFKITDFYSPYVLQYPCVKEDDSVYRFETTVAIFTNKYSKNCRGIEKVLRVCCCCDYFYILSLKQLIASWFSREGYICNACYQKKKKPLTIDFPMEKCSFCHKEKPNVKGCYYPWSETCTSPRYFRFTCNDCSIDSINKIK